MSAEMSDYLKEEAAVSIAAADASLREAREKLRQAEISHGDQQAAYAREQVEGLIWELRAVTERLRQ